MTNIRTIPAVPLSRRPTDWDGFFAALRDVDNPADFMDRTERERSGQDRDPFVEWHECPAVCSIPSRAAT
jgi:hypothetical protein